MKKYIGLLQLSQKQSKNEVKQATTCLLQKLMFPGSKLISGFFSGVGGRAW